MEKYRAIILGSGQGGNPLAHAFAKAGESVAVIEKEHVGGTCINEGCTPTKTMIASSKVAYLARRGADFGVCNEKVRVDLAKVRERKRAIVESFRSGSQKQLENNPHIDLIFGEAAFCGPQEVVIDGKQRIYGEKIFINTGCHPIELDVPGKDWVPQLNSRTIMELDTVPKHLVVVGAGYISLEFGQMFRRFGSRVTLIIRSDRILRREDLDITHAMTELMREEGIEFCFETQIERLEPDAQGMQVHLQNGTALKADALLVAIGRAPNTSHLNLPAANVTVDSRGYILANERLETSASNIYAMGDVKGGPAFTHISYDDYRILKTNLLEEGSRTTKERQVPYTLFTDPQLGRIGLTEQEACRQGLEVRIATMPMSHVARAIELDEPRGMMKAVVDAKTNHILGCAILGVEGGELMSLIQTAMLGGLPYTALRDAIWAHPTLAESLNNLFARI